LAEVAQRMEVSTATVRRATVVATDTEVAEGADDSGTGVTGVST